MFDEEFDKMPEPKEYDAVVIELDSHTILFCGEKSAVIAEEVIKRWNEYPELISDIGKREQRIIDLTNQIAELENTLKKISQGHPDGNPTFLIKMAKQVLSHKA